MEGTELFPWVKLKRWQECGESCYPIALANCQQGGQIESPIIARAAFLNSDGWAIVQVDWKSMKKLDLCITRNHSLVCCRLCQRSMIVQKSWTEWIQWIASGPMQHLEATEEHSLILSEDWRPWPVMAGPREWSGDVWGILGPWTWTGSPKSAGTAGYRGELKKNKLYISYRSYRRFIKLLSSLIKLLSCRGKVARKVVRKDWTRPFLVWCD